MAQHKWHKEIKAWADGDIIEQLDCGEWFTVKHPTWEEDIIYRTKPQPKEPQYLYVYQHQDLSLVTIVNSKSSMPKLAYIGKIKLEL